MMLDRASLAGRRWPVAFLLLATPVIAGLAALIAGQSVNWDLLNYHLYDPHALWTGRWAIDVAPGQAQSFHNPLLHVPYYLGYRFLDHRLLAFLLGVVQGLMVFPLYRLARGVVGDRLSRRGTFYVVALGMIGPMFLSQLGTMFGDCLLAIVVVMALALVIRSKGEAERPLLAGLLVGGATGLKLTMGVYVPGLVIAALMLEWNNHRWRTLLLISVGIAIGYALTAGWWMMEMHSRFDNPMFPFFNGFFESSWAPDYNHRDFRFLPGGFWQGLFKPLLGAMDFSSVMELKFRGPRVVCLFLTLLVLPVVLIRVRLPGRIAALTVFCAVSILIWSFAFGYYRYLSTIEVLAPLTLAAIWYEWGKGYDRAVNVIPILLILTQLGIKVPAWGRDEYGSLDLPLLVPDGGALVAGGLAPVAWLALKLDDRTPMIRIAGNLWQLGDGSAMSERADELISNHSGPLVAVAKEDELDLVNSQLRKADLYLDRLSCMPLQSRPYPSLSGIIWQCPVSRFNLGVTAPEEDDDDPE